MADHALRHYWNIAPVKYGKLQWLELNQGESANEAENIPFSIRTSCQVALTGVDEALTQAPTLVSLFVTKAMGSNLADFPGQKISGPQGSLKSSRSVDLTTNRGHLNKNQKFSFYAFSVKT